MGLISRVSSRTYRMSNAGWSGLNYSTDGPNYTNFDNVDNSSQSYAPINNTQNKNWSRKQNVKQKIDKWGQENLKYNHYSNLQTQSYQLEKNNSAQSKNSLFKNQNNFNNKLNQ